MLFRWIQALSILAVVLASTGCSTVWKVREFTDTAVAVQHELDLEALRQVQIERQRFGSARCHSPLPTPAGPSAPAEEADPGGGWVEELLRDCPQFSTFLSNLVVTRAIRTGLSVP